MDTGQRRDLAFGGGVRLCVLLQEVQRGRLFGGELSCLRDFLDWGRRGHFGQQLNAAVVLQAGASGNEAAHDDVFLDRKSTRLNSSHSQISYAVFCLKKKERVPTLTEGEPL